MNYKDFLIGILLIVIPLVLIIFWYRNYVYMYCKNDMKCLKKRLSFNLNDFNNKLKNIVTNDDDDDSQKSDDDNSQQIEGFFGGLGNFFGGSAPSSTLPVSPGSFPNESINTLEKKINDKMTISSKFPPQELNGNTDDFKDSDNSAILKSIGAKSFNGTPPVIMKNNDNKEHVAIFDKKELKPNMKEQIIKKKDIDDIVKPMNQSINSLLGKCQFYQGKCPDKQLQLGNFEIGGIESGSFLKCGNAEGDYKQATAVATIKNNKINEIHVLEGGKGYNLKQPPKITISAGKGNSASAEAIVDDDGAVKIIKVIDGGYNFNETPKIVIDAPYMNSSCHLCCSE